MDLLQKFKNFLGLSFALANADFKLRNEGSYLGILWYLLNPVFLFLLLLLVFQDRLGNDIPFYTLYLLLGIVMFNFFQETTLEATKTIKGYGGIIKSIAFSKESLIGALLLKRIYGHFFEVLLFIIVYLIVKGFSFNLIYYLLIGLLFVIFIYGFSLILASVVVYFVDLDNIWNFFVRLLWLGTPIFYEVGGQDRLLLINLFNPLYYFISCARDLIIYNRFPEIYFLVITIIFTFIFLLCGLIMFRLLKNKFAEMF